MLRTIKLIKYLPLFIQEYEEMQKIMTAENPEFQLLADTSEEIKNDGFISTCGLYGIARFERMLGITPNDYDTLEARRRRVLARWNNQLPYTWRVLLEKLSALCGEGNFDAELEGYVFTLVTRLSLSSQIDELNHLLNTILPANIQVNSVNELTDSIDLHRWTAGCVSIDRRITIDTDTRQDYELEINHNSTIGTIMASDITIK